MATILFLLLFFFVLLPIGRAAWAFWRQYSAVKRQFRAADEFRRAYQRAASGAREAASQPRRRKKKIDSDVGEYVAFEEIRTYTDGSGSADVHAEAASARFSAEQQVEDADWEDIK